MKTLLLAIFAAVSVASFGQNMQQYLSETNVMVTQKKYQEALERYVWFQDHALEKERSMAGVRLSFALSSWKSLADVYPPAMTALKEMRLNKTNAILDSNASCDVFADVVALNRTLKEENKTIELFESIARQHPDQSKLCWLWAKDALFDAKRYDIIKNYISSPMNEFALIKSQYEMTNAVQNSINTNQPEIKVLHDNNFVEQSLELIRFSIAVNDSKSAKAIREKALSIVNDKRLKDFKID